MKKKCMAVGGTAKKPATIEEQLASIRGKVRPGYQAGGPIYQSGNSFTDQQIGDPMKGIASAGMSGQVDSMLDRTKAMPNSIASVPQPYAGSVIPGQLAAHPSNAPGSTPQSMGYLGAADYSTGPKQGGFVYEDGTPRPTESNQSMQSTAPAPLLSMAEKEAAIGLNPNRIYRPGSAMDPLASGGGIAQALKTANDTGVFERPAMDQNQLAKFDVPRRQNRRRPEFSEGGMPKKQTYFGDRPPPQSAMNDDSPARPIPPRVPPAMPARPVSAPAQPVKVTLPAPEYPQERMRPAAPQSADAAPGTYPGVTGIVDAIRNRKVANAKAMDYEDGGMVETEDDGENKNKCSIEISIDIPVGDKKAKAKTAEAADYACGGKVKKLGMSSGGMVRFAGKGGPRDDKIPVKVAGQEINVSNGENAVILPAKTAANPAALYAIGGIIQATNDGRKPKMGMEKGGKYKDGAYPYDDKPPPTAQEVYAPTYAAPGSIISALPEGGYLRTPEGRAQVMDALSGKGLRPDVGILGPRNAAPVAQEQPQTVAKSKAAEPFRATGRPGAFAEYGEAGSAAGKGITAGVAQPSGAVVKDGMTTTQMGAGFDPTKLQMAPGYGMASNAAGKTISVGPSEYVGADGKPTSRWTDTQQYKDAIARNEADKLRLAEMQAQRLGSDPMAVQKASQGISQAVQQSGLAAQQAGQAQQVQQFAIDRAAREQSLIDAWDKAGTPEQKQAIAGQLKIMRGQQDKEGQFKDAIEEVVDEKTGQVIKRPLIYNASTGQPANQGQSQAQQSFKTADEVEAARKAGKIKSGDVVIINGRPARIN